MLHQFYSSYFFSLVRAVTRSVTPFDADAQRLCRQMAAVISAGLAHSPFLRDHTPVRCCGQIFGASIILYETTTTSRATMQESSHLIAANALSLVSSVSSEAQQSKQ